VYGSAKPVLPRRPEEWLSFPYREKDITESESQKPSMVGIGRDLCGSSSPTPLPKQGHLEQAAQDLVQEVKHLSCSTSAEAVGRVGLMEVPP